MIVRMKTKIEVANKLLKWLELHEMKNKNIGSVYTQVIIPFSNDNKIEYYESWKGWELLRTFGRIKGKYKQIHVSSYSPIVKDVKYAYTNKQLKDLIYKMNFELQYYHDLYWQNLGDNVKLTEHRKKLKPATCRGCELLKESNLVLRTIR